MVQKSTARPKTVREDIRINASEVIAFTDADLKRQDEKDAGLPEGSTVFLVTETFDEAGDKNVKRQAINPETMFLQISYNEDAEGNRTPIGGRAPRKTEAPATT